MAIRSLINKKRICLNKMGSFLSSYNYDLDAHDFDILENSSELFRIQKDRRILDEEWIRGRLAQFELEDDND